MATEVREEQSFGKIRSLLWPIYNRELKKFLPMALIFFLVTFNYNLLRASKDTLILTAPSSGAEALPFLKVWFMLPMAFFMTFLFTNISNKFGREKAFYIMVSIFLGFFFLFTFLLYPNRHLLHPHSFADKIEAVIPLGLKGFVALFRNWIFSLFYVMSELWNPMVSTVLFWGFANEITTVKEATRFYGILNLAANLTGILAGQVAYYLSKNIYYSSIPYGTSSWEQYIFFVNIIVLVMGIAIILTYRYLHKNTSIQEYKVIKSPPIKMSFIGNFRYLAKSKYLLCIALIVLGYNLSINLVEVVWKNQVKQLYPDPNEFTGYMGQVMSYTGYIATFTSLFISGFCLRRFSWTANALVPPIIVLSTGLLFFFIVLFEGTSVNVMTSMTGSSSLALGVMVGTMQNCFARASKYTLFDATKELSFVPLKSECKLKGKAAIDGVGSRLGKSGGSLIHQILLLFFVTITASTPFVALIFLVVISVWIGSVCSLGKQFSSILEPSPVNENPNILKPVEKTV